MQRTVFLLSLLAMGSDPVTTTCTTRRCLAEMLIKKRTFSQPQDENCTQAVYVPFMEYQTLSVDTKNLRLNSRLQASIRWEDSQLAWNTSLYEFDQVVLPVDKIWTPEFHVTNGIQTTMKHSSRDVTVYSNGTVRHNVIITAEVNCEINLFNYPFAGDECPVAFQTWSFDGCGTELYLGELKMVDGSHGDWQTVSVVYQKQSPDRNYIWVALRIKYIYPFITFLLPSILIILADVVSFALPLGGGERSSFKVTLVLSFTLFLNILNDQLPGDSQCSPIIRTHFCVCLVLLVVSMLMSMLLTRVAQDGCLVFCCFSIGSKNKGNKKEKQDEEIKPDISVVQLGAQDENTEMLRKVVKFLEAFNTKETENEEHMNLADKIDKTFFWLYFISSVVYFCAMTAVMVKHRCRVNHFEFWY